MLENLGIANFSILIWLALGIMLVAIIIIVISKFLKKDSDFVNIEKLLKQNNYKKALAISQKYLEENPYSYIVKNYIAQAYEGLNDHKNAIEYYEKTSIAAGTQGQTAIVTQSHLKVANLYSKIGKPKEALGYYVMVLEKQPKHSKALFEASEILYNMKNYKKAREYLEVLVKMKPDNLRAKFLLAKILYHSGKALASSEYLTDIIKRLPDSDVMAKKASLILSDVYFSLKRFEDAVDVLKPLLSDRERFENVLVKMITILIKAKKFNQAIDLANRNIARVNPSMKANILYQIASAYFKVGEIYKALSLWNDAYKINPSYMDLKDIISKYRVVLDNPKLSNIYTKNNNTFQEFATRLIKVNTPGNVIRNETFWIFIAGDSSHIVHKVPFPVSSADLDQVEKHLRNEILSNNNVNYYTLFGIADECKNHYIFRKLNEVSGNEFIKRVNSVS